MIVLVGMRTGVRSESKVPDLHGSAMHPSSRLARSNVKSLDSRRSIPCYGSTGATYSGPAALYGLKVPKTLLILLMFTRSDARFLSDVLALSARP